MNSSLVYGVGNSSTKMLMNICGSYPDIFLLPTVTVTSGIYVPLKKKKKKKFWSLQLYCDIKTLYSHKKGFSFL